MNINNFDLNALQGTPQLVTQANEVPKKQIRSFNRHKKMLLTHGKFKSIQQARAGNPGMSDEAIYTKLMDSYNLSVRRERRQRRETNNVIENFIKTKVKKLDKTTNPAWYKSPGQIVADIGRFITNMQEYLFNNYRGKTIMFVIKYANPEKQDALFSVIIPREFNLAKREIRKFADKLRKDSEDYLFDEDDKLFIYEPKDLPRGIDDNRVIQKFRDGVSHCVFQPIKNWINESIENGSKNTKKKYIEKMNLANELEQEYISGVPEDKLQDVCDKLQIAISIDFPAKIEFLKVVPNKKALKEFKFINTRLNHIDIMVQESKPTVVERETIKEIVEHAIASGQHVLYKRDKIGITSCHTLEGSYCTKNMMQDLFSQFESENDFHGLKIDALKETALTEYLSHACQYNQTKDFLDEESIEEIREWSSLKCEENTMKLKQLNLKHIDMQTAYANFRACHMYEGFLGKITDFRKTDRIMGVGIYTIVDLDFSQANQKLYAYNFNMGIYCNGMAYTSAELKMLSFYGVKYRIVCGCWGKSFEFDFPQYMKDKVDGTRPFAVWAGLCNSINYSSTHIFKTSDEQFVKALGQKIGMENVHYFPDLQECILHTKKQYVNHMSQITCFLTSYQRISTIEQLMVMDPAKIVRVITDGIYYFPHSFPLKNVFRQDNKINFGNYQAVSYTSNYDPNIAISCGITSCGEYKENFDKTLLLGPGGCGKTHTQLIDKGFVKFLYIAPSWKLARNKRHEYGCNSNVLYRVLSSDPDDIKMINGYNVLLIDECSMISEESKLNIFRKFSKTHKIIFAGDLGYQIPPESGICMSADGFDNVEIFTSDYRSKCPILNELKSTIRKMIDNNSSATEVNNYVIGFFKKLDRYISVEKMVDLYSISDMVLCGLKSVRDKITTQLSNKDYNGFQKYMIESGNRHYSKGDIIIDKNPPSECSSVVRHCFTSHSIQGETAHNKLFIHTYLWLPQMMYTCISRAKSIDQIYLLE